jgi:hypothetical protein
MDTETNNAQWKVEIMKKAWTCFTLTMAVLILSCSAYAETLLKEPLLYPCNALADERVSGTFSAAGLNQPIHVVTVDILHDRAQQWGAGKTYAYGQGAGSPYLEPPALSGSDDSLCVLHADWHLGNSIKLGAGYNFSGFSEELTEFDHDREGLFIYLIGKM